MNIFQVVLIQPLTNGLVVFYNLLFSNMGLAIIAFSIFLRLVLNPLTKPYMDSMKKMRDLGPELAKLKGRHKDDKQGLMKAQADFYKEKGINPTAGCLPYLLQIVVLIALYNVFTTVLTNHVDVFQKLNSLLYAPLKFADGTVLNTSFLYLDITKPDTFNLAGVPFALPGPILLLAALVQMVSAKMMSPYVEAEKKVARKTKEEGDDMSVAMQSSAIYTMPLITILIGVRFASGLALYWFVFSAYQVVQQYLSGGWGGLTPWLKAVRAIIPKISLVKS